MISVSAAAGEYSRGFKKPRGDWLTAMSRSFSKATILATVGHEQLVPSSRNCSVFQLIVKFTPNAAISGNPRQEALYRPA